MSTSFIFGVHRNEHFHRIYLNKVKDRILLREKKTSKLKDFSNFSKCKKSYQRIFAFTKNLHNTRTSLFVKKIN